MTDSNQFELRSEMGPRFDGDDAETASVSACVDDNHLTLFGPEEFTVENHELDPRDQEMLVEQAQRLVEDAFGPTQEVIVDPEDTF